MGPRNRWGVWWSRITIVDPMRSSAWFHVKNYKEEWLQEIVGTAICTSYYLSLRWKSIPSFSCGEGCWHGRQVWDQARRKRAKWQIQLLGKLYVWYPYGTRCQFRAIVRSLESNSLTNLEMERTEPPDVIWYVDTADESSLVVVTTECANDWGVNNSERHRKNHGVSWHCVHTQGSVRSGDHATLGEFLNRKSQLDTLRFGTQFPKSHWPLLFSAPKS